MFCFCCYVCCFSVRLSPRFILDNTALRLRKTFFMGLYKLFFYFSENDFNVKLKSMPNYRKIKTVDVSFLLTLTLTMQTYVADHVFIDVICLKGWCYTTKALQTHWIRFRFVSYLVFVFSSLILPTNIRENTSKNNPFQQ